MYLQLLNNEIEPPPGFDRYVDRDGSIHLTKEIPTGGWMWLASKMPDGRYISLRYAPTHLNEIEYLKLQNSARCMLTLRGWVNQFPPRPNWRAIVNKWAYERKVRLWDHLQINCIELQMNCILEPSNESESVLTNLIARLITTGDLPDSYWYDLAPLYQELTPAQAQALLDILA